MPGRKFGHNSPYDESGMPLGTETIDYDNADEVRMAQVKSTYVEPIPLNDPEYQPKQLSKKFTGTDKNNGLPHGQKGFNTAITEGVGVPEQVKTVDIEDPEEKRKLFVQEAEDKGFGATPELPKVEKQETVNEVKEEIKEEEKQEEDSDFEAELNKEEGEKKE